MFPAKNLCEISLFGMFLIWQDEISLLFLSRTIYITEFLSPLPFYLLFSRRLIAYFFSLTRILQITCTIYFVRIFVTFVCIFRILRRLNRLFQKYHLIFAVWSSLQTLKRAADPHIVTQLFSALRRKIFLRALFTSQASCPHGQGLPQYSCRSSLCPPDQRIRLSPSRASAASWHGTGSG